MATDDRKRSRTLPQWTTVAVTPFPPGWRVAWRIEGAVEAYPVAFVLIEEHRATSVLEPSGRWYEHNCDPPYETRVVPGYFDGPDLMPVESDDQFLGVFGPGEEIPE